MANDKRQRTMPKPLVGIVLGSANDLPFIREAQQTLESLNIPYEITICSAHRTPERARKYARTARARGLEVIIAVAGYAAHLAGNMASHTTIPIIGVPLDSSPLEGLDALLSIVQMPKGIPVATVTVGEAGAVNAALLAAEILSIKYKEIETGLARHRRAMARKAAMEDLKVKARFSPKGVKKKI